jgi:hypothetical protein
MSDSNGSDIQVLSHPALLEAAWLRVREWYRLGEWAPQPEFAIWELKSAELLHKLGRDLESRNYKPSPMPLLPHPKKKGTFRHYCQPAVRDQIAFAAFAVLLAPLFEYSMSSCSFGNRWYRGIWKQQQEVGQGKWLLRNWSLADRAFYQPYRRAHGLFRRVASWTVDAMLDSKRKSVSATGMSTTPNDYADDQLPSFTSRQYWKSFPPIERVYWSRLDLRFAYPSVMIETLRDQMQDMADKVKAGDDPFEVNLDGYSFSQTLSLYDSQISQVLMQHKAVTSVIDYFCDLLSTVRYIPFPRSNELMLTSPSLHPQDQQLPLDDGLTHQGLPTGLAISGLLLNVYLHQVDKAMCDFLMPPACPDGTAGRPGAFLRFADDMIVLAASSEVLLETIHKVLEVVSDPQKPNMNLCINYDKIEPAVVSEMLQDYRVSSTAGGLGVKQWFSQSVHRNERIRSLNRICVTDESRGSFVTELVERMSDIALEQAIDVLPERARTRLSRLQELVLFKPDDSVVPRATQLVFATNHLARAWLPEETYWKDTALLNEMRQSARESLLNASEKPRIWRAIWRLAVRRPIATAPDAKIEFENQQAEQWLLAIVSLFAETSSAESFVPPGVGLCSDSWSRWERDWPVYASFQRSAIVNAFCSVWRDVKAASIRLSESQSLTMRDSWVYRSLDESNLCVTLKWLRRLAQLCVNRLYDERADMLPTWETEALSLATVLLMSRRGIYRYWRRKGGSSFGVTEVAADLMSIARPHLSSRLCKTSHHRNVAGLDALLLLCPPGGAADRSTAQRVCDVIAEPFELLQTMHTLDWKRLVAERVVAAATKELEGHAQRLSDAVKSGPRAVLVEMQRYHVARQGFLGTRERGP